MRYLPDSFNRSILMAGKKRSFALVGVLWLLAIALGITMFLLYHDTRLSHVQEGFPHMPLYGAMVWWFFLITPLIGWTWGYFNDLKDDGIRRDYQEPPPAGD